MGVPAQSEDEMQEVGQIESWFESDLAREILDLMRLM